MDSYNRLLYPESPFLPPVSDRLIQSVIQDTRRFFRHPTVSICMALISLSLEQESTLLTSIQWLMDKFDVDTEGITLFTLGFSLVPNVITGTMAYCVLPPKDAFRVLCPPPNGSDLLARLNQYKAGLLPKTHYLCQSNILFMPPSTGLQIFQLCRTNLFTDHPMFATGIEACEICYKQLCDSLNTSAL